MLAGISAGDRAGADYGRFLFPSEADLRGMVRRIVCPAGDCSFCLFLNCPPAPVPGPEEDGTVAKIWPGGCRRYCDFMEIDKSTFRSLYVF